jgi:dipeptidyl aminopeptidase/acylaminoacyl peptidase
MGIYDRQKDTVYYVNTDKLPGIKQKPSYMDEYGKGGLYTENRTVSFHTAIMHTVDKIAALDIRSFDNKDRWIVLLDLETGKYTLLDHQHDEAWIGGPAAASSVQWISDQSVVFLTEKSGFSHVSSLDLPTGKKQDLTKGNFEIRNLVASHDRKFLYFLANQDHPGAVSWCRLNLISPGTIEKITTMKGGYEVQMSPDQKWIAYRFSTSNHPWELFVQENKPGMKPVQITRKAKSPEFSAYPWREPSVITIPASDGAVVYARLYTPEKKKWSS